MNFAAIFINRPIATILLTLALFLAGAISFTLLPVSSLPQVDFPTISVSAGLPGASPKNMASSVASPLERALGSIAGITEMTSVSSLGSTRITIQFDLDRDINGASKDVQAAINAALSDLPADLPSNPTYRQVNPADAPVMLISLTSETMTPPELYDLASTILAQKMAQVEGVGQVTVGGSSLPAVRVQINPYLANQLGLSLEEVRTAIANANVNLPKGAVESGDRYWQITANDRSVKAADYAPIIISWRDNSPVRLSDLAEVTDSVTDIHNSGLVNGRPAVIMAIFRQPGSNVIKTVEAVQAALASIKASIPAAVDVQEIFDGTATIRASLKDVTRTLFISVILVILVVFFFLRSVRATVVPGLAVTVSLVGALAGLYLLGFSLDNLSLMALTIATGFVVDDAIVVLENISRHREAGLPPKEAALTGSREVSFTVISISISLVAVFIPILFMGGIVGRLFREFAFTLTLAVSLVLSLTLTPMLCSRLLTGPDGPDSNPKGYDPIGRLRRAYERSLSRVLAHRRLVLVLWVMIVGLNVFMYIVVPKGFFPEQDTGRTSGALRADQSLSFQALKVKLAALLEEAEKDPAVRTVAGFTGSSSSSAFVFIILKPKEQRDVSADEVIVRLRSKLAGEPGVQLFLTSVQDIRVGGRSSRAA